ncbi:HD domain-containing protein [Mangrovicella endophytica]|uniref:HD domain-containing protein n=1 Tax=Mangrovicella endophytica TaxID=2066697 RepID=UPI0012FFE6B7|nr:HD domain-containing protein [Mangrovicella endophytica]
MSRPTFFRDPIHLQIRFDKVDTKLPATSIERSKLASWALQKIIDTDQFQRLRLIRQNGLANFVFHGAEHSRFSHSIGVHHVANRMFERICRNMGFEESAETRLEVLVAALIHDIGHGAFSHTLEEILKDNHIPFHHETMTERYIIEEGSELNAILKEADLQLPSNVAAYFDKKKRGNDHWKYKIVSSQMDADRLDYVQRDALFGGIKGHGFDFERLLDLLSVHDQRSIGVDRGAVEAVEAYLVTIDQMYRAIYYHQGVRAATQMLLSVFKRATLLWKEGDRNVFPAFGSSVHPIEVLLKEGSYIDLKYYNSITDPMIWMLIDFWKNHKDSSLSDLASRLLRRDLLKTMPITDVAFSNISSLRGRAIELTSKFISDQKCAELYVAVDDPSRTSYKGYNYTPESPDESIWLTGGGERDLPLEDVSNSAIVNAFKQKTYFPRLVVLPEVRDLMMA